MTLKSLKVKAKASFKALALNSLQTTKIFVSLLKTARVHRHTADFLKTCLLTSEEAGRRGSDEERRFLPSTGPSGHRNPVCWPSTVEASWLGCWACPSASCSIWPVWGSVQQTGWKRKTQNLHIKQTMWICTSRNQRHTRIWRQKQRWGKRPHLLRRRAQPGRSLQPPSCSKQRRCCQTVGDRCVCWLHTFCR